MDPIVDRNKFPSLRPDVIGEDRYKSLRLLTVYGFEGKDVLIITKEDKVYCYGRNRFGALGLGHNEEDIESLQFNPYLSGKEVIDLSFGSQHWIALTSSGQCFVWGNNTFGQLADEDIDQSFIPKQVKDLSSLKIVKVRTGDRHTLVLTNDGQLYGWGRNKYGQVATNVSINVVKPIKIEIPEKIRSIACGLNHSMALTSSGKAYIWGLANDGRLGMSNNFRYYEPQLVSEDILFQQITCGPNHSLLLSTDGHIYAFGDNSNGQIGNGTLETQYKPHKLEMNKTFRRLVANKVNDLSLGITNCYICYIWGQTELQTYLKPKDITEELMNQSIHDIYAKFSKIKIYFVTVVNGIKKNELKVRRKPKLNLSDKVWHKIQIMNKKITVRESTSTIASVSDSKSTETNVCEESKSEDQVISVHNKTIDDFICYLSSILKDLKLNEELKKKIRLIHRGFFNPFVIIVTAEDEVYCSGSNKCGYLGLGNNDYSYRDKVVLNKTLSGKELVDIVSGHKHCIGLTKQGKCLAWGQNESGQLGIGWRPSSSYTPVFIDELSDQVIVGISCGSFYTLALTIDGEVYAWGENYVGQLGNKCFNCTYVPKKVVFDRKIVSISCGKSHSIAIDTNGTALVWGCNSHGQLGREPHKDIRSGKSITCCNRPSKFRGIGSNEIIAKVACGMDYTLLLTKCGKVYAFGKNDFGQVGNGTEDNQSIPLDLKNRMKIKDIITHPGNDLSLAISEDNRYYVWGLVGDQKVLRPKLYVITDEKSVFDIYIKCAKNKTLFKTLDVNEDTNYCLSSDAISVENKEENRCDFGETCDGSDSNLVNSTSNPTNICQNNSIYNITNKTTIASNLSLNSEVSSMKTSLADTSLSNTLKNRLKESFNNPKDSDLKFICDNKTIYCQKSFIKFRNKKFWQKVKQNLNEKNEFVIDSDGIKFEAIKAFVRYLYELDIELNEVIVFRLKAMADIFEEKELLDQCSQYIHHLESHINLSNVCSLYEKAVTLGLTDLEKSCVEFVSKNSLMTRLVMSATKCHN